MHSDHLLDRVRMEVRDSTTKLKPEDVSILFFERDDLDVHIHSLRFDEEGNVLTLRRVTADSSWKRLEGLYGRDEFCRDLNNVRNRRCQRRQ